MALSGAVVIMVPGMDMSPDGNWIGVGALVGYSKITSSTMGAIGIAVGIVVDAEPEPYRPAPVTDSGTSTGAIVSSGWMKRAG